MMYRLLATLIFVFSFISLKAQNEDDSQDATIIRSIYNDALVRQQGYKWLKQLTEIGPRLSGSAEADASVNHFKKVCDSMGFNTWFQAVKVPVWKRGETATCSFSWSDQPDSKTELAITALGGSIATPENGIKAQVVEITDFNQLDSLDLNGKIAFYNIPMNPIYISTFYAYGNAGKQRWAGAIEASKRGAVASINRSLSSSINNYPHTGSMSYKGADKKIPAASISTLASENLSKALQKDPNLWLEFTIDCEPQDSAISYNLIAEQKGKDKPDEIILVGGHIDSWDLGTGAHDDGAGCIHSLEAAYLLKNQNVQLKRTLRVVFFINEEFGLAGAKAYAKESTAQELNHIIAIESDGGGFSPRGIGITASESKLEKIRSFRTLMEPYGIYQFAKGGGGADIGPLKRDNNILIGLRPDSHRYFEVHHTKTDILENVNARELEIGSATIASIIYLLDKYDVNDF